jgi:3,4-dihydroxy 2-butanone 4-phosphate synthase/GTP cyclohydrolase II
MKDGQYFLSIDEAIAHIREGKTIVIVDDEERENEGDLVVAAEKATPEVINFFATQARGLICTPVASELAKKLEFPPMVQKNEESTGCNFSVSVDLRRGIASGISAHDRSKTIRHIVSPDAKPDDFVKPGHVFPLSAKDGGVLVRAGHTEAVVDIVRMAGLSPAGVLCEIMNDDGTMARFPDLVKYAKKHDIGIISIAALIAYRQKKEILVEEVAHASIPTVFGIFQMRVFREKMTGREHVAMVKGDLSQQESPLVRVHSECLTGDVFQSFRCDCRNQLDASLYQIAEEGTGVLVRMAQEGRGIGLAEKIKAYAVQDEKGLDTVEANTYLGFKDDLRDYGTGAQILQLLGISKMRLLTNNPRKIVGLSGYGLEITERIPIVVGEMEINTKYLQTKKEKLGHFL